MYMSIEAYYPTKVEKNGKKKEETGHIFLVS